VANVLQLNFKNPPSNSFVVKTVKRASPLKVCLAKR